MLLKYSGALISIPFTWLHVDATDRSSGKMWLLLMILLKCVTSPNAESPLSDVSCIPNAITWLKKTCEWSLTPFVSTKTNGMLECSELIAKTEECVSGRYDMWTGVCDMSQEACEPVAQNYPHAYMVAFVRAANEPLIPQDDCLIVRKGKGKIVYSVGVASIVQCKPDEVVTACDCDAWLMSNCAGVTITHSGTRCNAISITSSALVATASCGRALAGSTVTSNPETGFSAEPSVQCPNADSNTVLFGCYVHSDGTVLREEFKTQGIIDGHKCKAPPGCTACRVTAVCTQGGYPGTWNSLSSGYCVCASVLYGAVQTEANKVSSVQCPAGETVTSCECDVEGGEPCNGALVSYSNSLAWWRPGGSTCWVFTNTDGPKVRAKACCGKIPGQLQVVWEPALPSWTEQVLTDPASVLVGTEKPSAKCWDGWDLIGCTVYSPEGEKYHSYMDARWRLRRSHDRLVSKCTTSWRCRNCIVAAWCKTVLSDYGEFGPWSQCSATCGEEGVQTRSKPCDNPTRYCTDARWEAAKPTYERRQCNRRSCLSEPYLLVGVRLGIDKVDMADGKVTRIVRVQNGFNAESIRNIGYDYHLGYIFYIVRTDAIVWTIRRCSLTGANDMDLMNFDAETRALTIDTSGLKLWYATRRGRIESSDYNGANRQRIHSRGRWTVTEMVFHAKYDHDAQAWERRIFWREETASTTDGENKERIVSSTDTGSDIRVLVRVFSSPYPTEAISLNGPLLYWWKEPELHTVDIYTKTIQNLGAIPRPLYIDTHGHYMYVARRRGSGSVVSRLSLSDMSEQVISDALRSPESAVLVREDQMPSNGRWTDWSWWDGCTASECTSRSLKTRRRTCDPPPFLQTFENGCQGFDHQVKSCYSFWSKCDGPQSTVEQIEEKNRMLMCRLYVDDASLVAVESDVPYSKENAKTLVNCRTDCKDRGLTCAQSLRVHDRYNPPRNGKPQVEKKPCTSKYADICCCV